ncbi:hypothetical protein SLS60_005774 [Paraconiothyrium brasiliense]|uniref:Uncharacterized protein n=1 Tax=Paraconiothyrium brasiliense TaxID=300254 RepID=A0ABR3RDI1_9PLEO
MIYYIIMDNHNSPAYVTSPLARLRIPTIPITDHRHFDECTELYHPWTGTIIRADEPSMSQEKLDDALLNSDEEVADTHLKQAAESFFRVYLTTFGIDEDPGHAFRAWEVTVDEQFKPDPKLCCKGFISQVTAKNTKGKPHKNNRWILYTLMCLAVEVGIQLIWPVDEENIVEKEHEVEGWDRDRQVDSNFVTIYNAVRAYYQMKKASGEAIKTDFLVPVLFPPISDDKKIRKCELREVDTKPWLEEDPFEQSAS